MFKIIASSVFACVLAAALPAGAQVPNSPANPNRQPGATTFAKHKEHELERIAQHLQATQALQSCVQGANNREALKACHDAAQAAMARDQAPDGKR